MKKIFIFLILGILLATPLISATDWDNKLYYSENDLKVTITNSFLLLFPTSEIGTAKLKSHPSVNYVREVGAGNQVVMWYDFNFIELYLNGLGKVEFTDMKTGKEIDRDYSFVYWGKKERNVYGCEYSFSANGTKICNSIIIGKETYNDWLPYNSKDIPKGNIRIGLMTYVEIDDKVDGVWTITGRKISRHAEWTVGLDVDLVSYFTLNETSGTTAYDELSTNNLTNYNSVAINQTGKIGTSYDWSSATNKYLEKASPTGMGNTDLSGSMWVYLDDADLGDTLTTTFYDGEPDVAISVKFSATNTTLLELSLFDGTSIINTTDFTAYFDKWTHVSWGVTATNMKLYLDGNLKINETISFARFGATIDEFVLGNSDNRVRIRAVNGKMDEVGIWNRTLTQGEVTLLS